MTTRRPAVLKTSIPTTVFVLMMFGFNIMISPEPTPVRSGLLYNRTKSTGEKNKVDIDIRRRTICLPSLVAVLLH
jgi:hypothetical protein